jgi:hypothetical protein
MPSLETHPQTSDKLTLETFSENEKPVEAPAVEEAPVVEKKK